MGGDGGVQCNSGAIEWAGHCLISRKAEPDAWAKDSLGIRHNHRGTILGPGKKGCSKLQRHHAGVPVRLCLHARATEKQRIKISQGRQRGSGTQQRHFTCMFQRTDIHTKGKPAREVRNHPHPGCHTRTPYSSATVLKGAMAKVSLAYCSATQSSFVQLV